MYKNRVKKSRVPLFSRLAGVKRNESVSSAKRVDQGRLTSSPSQSPIRIIARQSASSVRTAASGGTEIFSRDSRVESIESYGQERDARRAGASPTMSTADIGNIGEPISQSRENLAKKWSYIMPLLGFAVGFGNIWRFPYLLNTNGGAVFLIIYLTMVIFCGIPLFYMELAIGQRYRKGALGSWNAISPYLAGIGISCAISCFFVAYYYSTLVAWVLFYMGISFRNPVPWSSCKTLITKFWGSDEKLVQIYDRTMNPAECWSSNQPVNYYFYRRILDISEDINIPGDFSYPLFIVISLGLAVVCGILSKGIKITEKIVFIFFTSIFPYVVLIFFFFVSFSKPGFQYGYTFGLFRCDWEKLLDPSAWFRAGGHIFFSSNVGYGMVIAFSSNTNIPQHNNCWKDTLLVAAVTSGTSIFASFVLFPYMGILGKTNFDNCVKARKFEALVSLGIFRRQDVHRIDNFNELDEYEIVSEIENELENKGLIFSVLDQNHFKINRFPIFFDPRMNLECDLKASIMSSGSGTGMFFIGFTKAVASLPFSPMWSFLFFLMCFTLAIFSIVNLVEGVITTFLRLKSLRWPRWLAPCLFCGILWAFSLFFCYGWGYYIFNFLDQFVVNLAIFVIGFSEAIGIAWVYGSSRFANDVKWMTGSRPNRFILICWKFLTPGIILQIILMNVVEQYQAGYTYERYTTRENTDTETVFYSGKCIAIGYFLAMIIIMWIPLQATLCYFGKSLVPVDLQRLRYSVDEELVDQNEKSAWESGEEGDDKRDHPSTSTFMMGKSNGDLERRRSSKMAKSQVIGGEGEMQRDNEKEEIDKSIKSKSVINNSGIIGS